MKKLVLFVALFAISLSFVSASYHNVVPADNNQIMLNTFSQTSLKLISSCCTSTDFLLTDDYPEMIYLQKELSLGCKNCQFRSTHLTSDEIPDVHFTQVEPKQGCRNCKYQKTLYVQKRLPEMVYEQRVPLKRCGSC
jgi:hypothetical protein